MSDMREQDTPHLTTTELAFEIFQRVIAIFCLIAGLRYWALLIGISELGAWRFDLLPVHWKIAAASLAVLWPVAGIGLWMIVSWGPVIWLVAAATEIIMHAGFPELYGSRWLLVVAHFLVALIYGGFRIGLYFSRRETASSE
ncbi:MAG: DUF6163 family protein [Alphaproteobacteria bacterium]|nr:DUF6163 family protein [Alphaproteobacteria bacterium]